MKIEYKKGIMIMNNKFIKFLAATQVQTFASILYNFGFMIIFYQLTDNLVVSSTLSAVNIITTRLISILIVPKMKYKNPLKVSSASNLMLAVISILAIPLYSMFHKEVVFYFLLNITISYLENIDNSFQYSVIPSLVDKDYLFKANSLNAMIFNIGSIIAPMLSYLFYRYSDLRYFLLVYGIINLLSSFILSKIEYKNEEAQKSNDAKKTSVLNEWKKTFNIMSKNTDIVFCISIALCINLIFAGLNGPILLSMGQVAANKVLGQTFIKVVLSAGSIIGIWAVYKLKVKEKYNQYLKISIVGIAASLGVLGLSENINIIYGSFFTLSLFIMFIMNSTGTRLQIATPKEEITSVYTFRSSLLSIVVPVSYLITGGILQYFGRQAFFIFSIVLLVITVVANTLVLKAFSRRKTTNCA